MGTRGILILAAWTIMALLPRAALAASAVAYDKDSHQVGFCHHKASAEEAAECALRACKKGGGAHCRILEKTARGGYSAVAGTRGHVGTFLGSYEDEKMVSMRAVADCAVQAAGCDMGDFWNSEFDRCVKQSGCKLLRSWHEDQPSAGKAKGTPVHRGDAVPQAQPSVERTPAAPKPAAAEGGRDAFIGSWYGTAMTVGTIVVKADGSYEYGGTRGGTWQANGNQIVFKGNLAAWDNGRATLKGGNLEFYWTTADGANHWFSFAK